MVNLPAMIETGSGVDFAWSGAGHGHVLTCTSTTAAGASGVFVDVVREAAPADADTAVAQKEPLATAALAQAAAYCSQVLLTPSSISR